MHYRIILWSKVTNLQNVLLSPPHKKKKTYYFDPNPYNRLNLKKKPK